MITWQDGEQWTRHDMAHELRRKELSGYNYMCIRIHTKEFLFTNARGTIDTAQPE